MNGVIKTAPSNGVTGQDDAYPPEFLPEKGDEAHDIVCRGWFDRKGAKTLRMSRRKQH